MTPVHYILSHHCKNIDVTVVLWHRGDYHYEIDITGHSGYMHLLDTDYETAMTKYAEVIRSFGG